MLARLASAAPPRPTRPPPAVSTHPLPRRPRAGPDGPALDDAALRLALADAAPHTATGLEFNVEGITSAPALRACKRIRTLSLNVNRLPHTDDLAGLTSLTDLQINDNSLGDVESLDCRW